MNSPLLFGVSTKSRLVWAYLASDVPPNLYFKFLSLVFYIFAYQGYYIFVRLIVFLDSNGQTDWNSTKTYQDLELSLKPLWFSRLSPDMNEYSKHLQNLKYNSL